MISNIKYVNNNGSNGFSFYSFGLFRRYWNQEVQQAAKDLRPPKLSKVLIQCYWKPYSVIGISIFIEVHCGHTAKAHIYCKNVAMKADALTYWCQSTHELCFSLFCQEIIKVIQPLLLGKLIEYFERYDPNQPAAVYEAYTYAAGISLTSVGLALLHHLYFYQVQRAGMKIRVAMCHMIYRKVSRF